MQSIQCFAVRHTWALSGTSFPLKNGRGEEKLIKNDPTETSSSVRLGVGTPARRSTKSTAMKQPFGALVVEEDTYPRKEKNAERKQRGNNGRVTGGKNERNLQSDQAQQVPRTRVHGALHYLESLPEFLKDDGGPPRWFCPVQKSQQAPAPLLLSLPGILGTGGLMLHYEVLGRLFELRCLHIPIMDRTPFEGLVSLVEDTVREEAKHSPRRTIYIVGENFGGALALAVAAQNPGVDLVLILVNPSTSFDKSALQPMLPIIQALPPQMFTAAPFLMGFLLGDPSRFASSHFTSTLPPFELVQQVSGILFDFITVVPKIIGFLSKETVLWKMEVLNSSAKHANSRLGDVKAEVLVLASNRDQLLPSLEEARRLSKILPKCTFRQFQQSSHSLLLEDDFDLATVIKSTGLYRQTGPKDPVANFTPPTEEEIAKFYDSTRLLRRLTSPVFFSTRDDGEVVQGLSMIPSKGPIIFVGCHALLGLDMKIVASELLNTRQLLLRGLGHPILFEKELLEEHSDRVEGDLGRLFGAVPVSGKNMFKLLARGDNIALYPGGAREALHRKGEAHKLFWPDQPEFVRMASKFGATMIPMCTVGVDEIFEILVDFNEMTSIPLMRDWIMDYYKALPQLRSNLDGEVSKQALHMPVVAPKLSGPGRMYILFGQPIYTEGKSEYFRDQKNVTATYHQLKTEVEAGMSYLLAKREEDPYRAFLPRIWYEIQSGGEKQAPTFKLE